MDSVFCFFFKMLHWHEQGLPPVFLNTKKGIPQIVKFNLFSLSTPNVSISLRSGKQFVFVLNWLKDSLFLFLFSPL